MFFAHFKMAFLCCFPSYLVFCYLIWFDYGLVTIKWFDLNQQLSDCPIVMFYFFQVKRGNNQLLFHENIPWGVFFWFWCREPGTMPAATVDHSQRICEVWASNLDEEMKRIRQVTRKFNYIAMVSFKVLMLYSNQFSFISQMWSRTDCHFLRYEIRSICSDGAVLISGRSISVAIVMT